MKPSALLGLVMVAPGSREGLGKEPGLGPGTFLGGSGWLRGAPQTPRSQPRSSPASAEAESA